MSAPVQIIASDFNPAASSPAMMNSDLRALFDEYVAPGASIKLPEVPEGKEPVFIVPVSSGLDSTCTALAVAAYLPQAKVRYVFTDTGVEAAGTMESLEAIETVTGQSVERLSAGKDLYELVEANGGFIPDGRARYCTRQLKLEPYLAWLKQFEDEYVFSFVGIRADEPSRSGSLLDNPNHFSLYPLRDLGLGQMEVSEIVDRIISIPSFYMHRSRSGCSVCIFSRRSELIASWLRDRDNFMRAARLEKLPEGLESVLSERPSFAVDSSIGSAYVRPAAVTRNYGDTLLDAETRTRASRVSTEPGLFEDKSKTLYVAVEYHGSTASYFGDSDWAVHSENIVTYSATLGGLKLALKFWSEHRRRFERMTVLPLGALDDEVRVAILQVHMEEHEDLFDCVEQEDKQQFRTYTWQSDAQPLLAIAKTHSVLDYILRREGLQQALTQADGEQRELISDAIQATKRFGSVRWAEVYEIPELEVLVNDADVEAAPTPCLMCSK